MNVEFQKRKIVPFVFLWIGFVGAISFMEAWLKFQAPGITKELGLGIGRLVFSALNKIEIILAICIFLFATRKGLNRRNPLISIWILLAYLILIVDSCWLLPELNERAVAIINGLHLPKSNLHIGYVSLEIIKVIALFIYGSRSLRMKTITGTHGGNAEIIKT